MYLGILVLSCVVFGLVHVNGKTIQCPVCSGWGNDPLTSCDSNIVYKSCTYEEPICLISKHVFSSRARVNRLCSSMELYDGFVNYCKTSGRPNCPEILRGYCTESRCNATLPGKPFSCPFCTVYDAENKADGMTKCDAAVEDRACLSSVKDPVCSTYSEDEVFKRKCMSKARYERFAADCKLSDNCFMAMCEKSGCTASV